MVLDPVVARVDALWRDGPFRGQAPALAAEAGSAVGHPREAELRAFAMLATLREGERARLAFLPGLIEPGDDDPAAHALVHAANAWLGAIKLDALITWEAQERLAGALERAAAEAAASGTGADRHAAALAWGSLAVAECAVMGGDADTARRHLTAASQAPDTPAACRLAASGRLAELDGLNDPHAAVRRLDDVAEAARALGQDGERLHALTIGGLLELTAGDRVGGRTRLERAIGVTAPEGSVRHQTLARLLLAVTEDRPDSDAALEQLAEAIRLSASDGDHLSYTVVLGLAADVYHARGADADALLTLSNGIHQLRTAGLAALALPVEAKREALRSELGEERYTRAMEAAVALLERDLQRAS